MISTELKNIVESIIFASEDEINSKQIKDIVDRSGLRISIAEVEESVNVLNDEFKTNNKSFEILKIAGGFSFATKKEYGRFIGKLIEDKQRKKLSPSALETLAIIAYKQPITRSEMEFIRGVNVDYIVNSLLEKEMITIQGRSEAPGRPILYGTTVTFLKVLGLNSLEDLPKLKEINEILKDQEIEGITEADIELFNSVNNPDLNKETDAGHQLELISSDDFNVINTEQEEIPIDNESISEDIGTDSPDNSEEVISETSESQNEDIVTNDDQNEESANIETGNGNINESESNDETISKTVEGLNENIITKDNMNEENVNIESGNEDNINESESNDETISETVEGLNENIITNHNMNEENVNIETGNENNINESESNDETISETVEGLNENIITNHNMNEESVNIETGNENNINEIEKNESESKE